MSVRNLTDADGFLWDLADDYGAWGSNVINGTSDAFDFGVQLSVNGTVFGGAFAADELAGRQLVVTGTMGGVEVSRRMYVPESGGEGWARFLESFTNPTGAAVTVTITIKSNSGNDGWMNVIQTSSGDNVFTTSDRWIVNDDSADGNGLYYYGGMGDPTVAHVFTDGRMAPTSVGTTVFDAAGNEGIAYTYTLTIPAGQTVSFLHFVTQQANMAGINAELPTLATPDATALYGLTSAQLSSIANFSLYQEATITFDGMMALPDAGTHRIGSSYGEDGFTFSSNLNGGLWVAEPGQYSYYHLSDSPHLNENYWDQVTTLTRSDGQSFGVISTRGQLLTNAVGNLVFVATFENGTTQTFTYTTDANPALDNIVFPVAFASGIVSMTITSTVDWWTMDDMVLRWGMAPPMNDAPIASGDSYSVAEDALLIIAAPGVLANDTDADGDPLTSILVTGPSHGTLILNSNGGFQYTPNANYHGADSFTYRANDGEEAGNLVTVNITVNSVNDAPTATDDSFEAALTDEDTVHIISASALLGNDTDPDTDDVLTISAVSGTSDLGATVTLNGDGTISYDPRTGLNHLAGGAEATDSFTYTISDGNGGTSTATVTFKVTGVNDAPPDPVDTDATGDGSGNVRASISEHLEVGAAIGIDADSNDPDDGDEVEYYFKDEDGNRTQTRGHFSIDALTGAVTLAAAVNYELATSHMLTIFVSDGELESSSTFTVNVENVVEHLFTAGNDIVDFNTLPPGAYDIDGAEYDALAGDDNVILASLATTATPGHAWNYATTFNANDGNDTVEGRDGNDRISGGNGNDLLSGGDGNDRLWGDAGTDNLSGGNGDDTLHGGADADLLSGDAGDDTLSGGAGADSLSGGDGNDILHGGDDADMLYGGVGNDTVNGDGGADSLWGGTGGDTLSGGAGNDTLHGEDGNVTISGGADHDLIYGGAGSDDVWGDGGNDSVYGGDGNDTLRGNVGDDLLYGELGNDWIYGGSGADYLDGGDGADRLFGGSGDDILAGGAGSDKLTGSAGKDIFIFTKTEIGTTSRGAHDVITDFLQGADKIDFSALYDGGMYNGLKAGALSGRTTDAYKVGYYSEAGKTWIEGDINGDGRADFVVEMTGAFKLTGTDLIVGASVTATQAQWATLTGGLDYNLFHNDALWF